VSKVQLLPHADHIIVLNEEGKVAQKGSFESLNSAEGYVAGLGLKAADMEKAAEADAESVEIEMEEKEAVIAKIASIKAQEAKKQEQEGVSRGRRNKAALLTYIKSMGKIPFAVFAFFTLGNIGFRSAQRKFGALRRQSRLC
jgi:ATP-binding cassette, subfamily C (CFTR/MRP), member 1